LNGLPRAKPLAELEHLEPGLLFVFVAGPGMGEGIAVALPEKGWLLIDGCKTADDFPLRALFERYQRPRDDDLIGYVLTHPHRDHAFGVDEVIERLAPKFVGVAAPRTGPSVAHEYEALATNRDPRVTSNELRLGTVRQAVRAIIEFGGTLVGLHTDVALPLQRADVCVTARSPDAGALASFLDN